MSADRDAAIKATDAAIDQVDAAADAAWKEAAEQTVRRVAEQQAELTADDIWVALARDHPEVHTHEPSALGPVMRRTASAGMIDLTDRVLPSARVSQHRNQLRVWSSLIYGGEPRQATPRERLEAALAEKMSPDAIKRDAMVRLGWIQKVGDGYKITATGKAVIADGR